MMEIQMSENVFTEEQIQQFLKEKLESGEYIKCERFHVVMDRKMCKINSRRYPLVCAGCPNAEK